MQCVCVCVCVLLLLLLLLWLLVFSTYLVVSSSLHLSLLSFSKHFKHKLSQWLVAAHRTTPQHCAEDGNPQWITSIPWFLLQPRSQRWYNVCRGGTPGDQREYWCCPTQPLGDPSSSPEKTEALLTLRTKHSDRCSNIPVSYTIFALSHKMGMAGYKYVSKSTKINVVDYWIAISIYI